jgi:hypothetical protein
MLSDLSSFVDGKTKGRHNLIRRQRRRHAAVFPFYSTLLLLFTMKTAAILATLFAGAAAFAPSSSSTTKSSVSLNAASFEGDIGALLPLGFWDPLRLVADGDQEKFDRLRAVELKHGRIAMLAVVGWLVQEAGIRLPGDINLSGLAFEDIPNGYAALEAIPYMGKIQLLLAIGALEALVWKQAEGSFPGDFSATTAFPVGWVADFDEATKLRKRAIELNNGRAAQMGILALMVHEQLGVSLIPYAQSTAEYTF